MTWDLQWDDEVDVVCTDSGIAGLAGAIAAVDQGADVLVASSPTQAVEMSRRHGWFTVENGDQQTMEYLAELAGDLDTTALPQSDDDLPIRPVPQPGGQAGRAVPPFYGSRLRDWAARCIPSPTGYLYTRVGDWAIAATDAVDGEAIEVVEIGSLQTGSGDVVGASQNWLDAEAHSYGLNILPVLGLQRLVFGDGEVIGASFATGDGPLTVRARHGLLLCGKRHRPERSPRLSVAGDAALRITLVGKAASRFGRVELHTSDPVAGPFPGVLLGALTGQAGHGGQH